MKTQVGLKAHLDLCGSYWQSLKALCIGENLGQCLISSKHNSAEAGGKDGVSHCLETHTGYMWKHILPNFKCVRAAQI